MSVLSLSWIKGSIPMLVGIDTGATTLEEIFCNSDWTLWCWGWHCIVSCMMQVSAFIFLLKVLRSSGHQEQHEPEGRLNTHFFCDCNKYLRRSNKTGGCAMKKICGVHGFEFKQMKEEEEWVEQADQEGKQQCFMSPERAGLLNAGVLGESHTADPWNSCELYCCLSQTQW